MAVLYFLIGIFVFSFLMKLFFYIKSKSKNQISKKQKVLLNGIRQKILLEGRNRDLPVLIMLHGGPGVAFPFGSCCRGAFPQLTEHFITVYWDQYGCGNNYHKLKSDFTIETYNQMVTDLITVLNHDFPQNKIYLFGISWGSFLAGNAAVKTPEKIDGVITYGQVLSFADNNHLVRETLKSCSLDMNELETLASLSNMDLAHAKDKLDDLADKYTNGSTYKGKDVSNKFFMKLWVILFSPDYTLVHHLLAQTGYLNIKNNTKILNQLADADLREVLSEVKIPYHIVQGKHDLTTATKLVTDFVDKSNNSLLEYQILQKSSHMPGAEDLNLLLTAMLPDIIKSFESKN